MSRMSNTVVSRVTISSTNITGLRASVRGLSFRKACPIAGTTIFGSSKVVTGIRLRIFDVSIAKPPTDLKYGAGLHRELLNDRAERERREERETANDQDDA